MCPHTFKKKFNMVLEEPPFPCHVSPFLTRDYSYSTNRRVILDLSFPVGQSVNNKVPKDKYFGSYFELKYPSIDDIVASLKELGIDALLYKIYLSRPFRHIRTGSVGSLT